MTIFSLLPSLVNFLMNLTMMTAAAAPAKPPPPPPPPTCRCQDMPGKSW